MRIIAAGVRSTVQDAGRSGHAREGIPASGPADPAAFQAAQRLVGNTPAMAAIEIVGTPFAFVLDTPAVVAVTGRDVRIRTRWAISGWTSAFVRAGEEAIVEGTRRTRFAYLAVSGGFEAPAVLGSRSTYLPAGLGPEPLRAGDNLSIGRMTTTVPAGRRAELRTEDGTEVSVLAGPHRERFSQRAMDVLLGSSFRVSELSDRTGTRLEGPTLDTDRSEILSCGLLPGAIQVPHGGKPIVLLADHPTTGGYPIIAVVAAADLWRVAQAAPGDALRFRECDRDSAVEALSQERRWLDAIA